MASQRIQYCSIATERIFVVDGGALAAGKKKKKTEGRSWHHDTIRRCVAGPLERSIKHRSHTPQSGGKMYTRKKKKHYGKEGTSAERLERPTPSSF